MYQSCDIQLIFFCSAQDMFFFTSPCILQFHIILTAVITVHHTHQWMMIRTLKILLCIIKVIEKKISLSYRYLVHEDTITWSAVRDIVTN